MPPALPNERPLFNFDTIFFELQRDPRCRSAGNICLRVDFTLREGLAHPDADAVRRAFRRVQRRHRLLRCVFERADAAHWLAVELPNGFPVPHVSVDTVESAAEGDAKADAMLRNLLNSEWNEDHVRIAEGDDEAPSGAMGDSGAAVGKRPFSTTRPRVYEIALGLVSVSSERWHSVLLCVNHSMCDLQSTHIVMRELLVALARPDVADGAPEDDGHFIEHVRRMTPGFLTCAWRGRSFMGRYDEGVEAVARACPSLPSAQFARAAPRHTLVAMRRISPDVGTALRESSKARGVTLHAPLSAAALYAQLKQAERASTLRLDRLKRGPAPVSDGDSAAFLLPFAPSIDLRRRLADDRTGAKLVSADSVQANSVAVSFNVPVALRPGSEGAPFTVSRAAFWETAAAVGRLQGEADAAKEYMHVLGAMCRMGRWVLRLMLGGAADSMRQGIMVGNSGAFAVPAIVREGGIEVVGGFCTFSQVNMAAASAPYVACVGFPDGSIGVTMQGPSPFFTQEALESQADSCAALLAEFTRE